MKRTTGVSVMAACIFDRTSWDRKRRQPTVRLEVKAVVTEDRSKPVCECKDWEVFTSD